MNIATNFPACSSSLITSSYAWVLSQIDQESLLQLCEAHLINAVNSNADNVEPQEADILVLEAQWFNHPDLYDFSETERTNEELQAMIS